MSDLAPIAQKSDLPKEADSKKTSFSQELKIEIPEKNVVLNKRELKIATKLGSTPDSVKPAAKKRGIKPKSYVLYEREAEDKIDKINK